MKFNLGSISSVPIALDFDNVRSGPKLDHEPIQALEALPQLSIDEHVRVCWLYANGQRTEPCGAWRRHDLWGTRLGRIEAGTWI